MTQPPFGIDHLIRHLDQITEQMTHPEPEIDRTFPMMLGTAAAAGALIALVITGWHDIFSRVGLAVLSGLVVWLIATVAETGRVEKLRQARRKAIEEADTQIVDESEQDYGHSTEQREFNVAGETFSLAALTPDAVQAVIDAQWEPSEETTRVPGGFTHISKQDQKNAIDSHYNQLAMLLLDGKGEHPSTEYLRMLLPVDNAQKLLMEVFPG